MRKVVIIGAGGHAKVIADLLIQNQMEIAGFLDDNPEVPETILGFPYLGTLEQIESYRDSCCFVIAIGNNAVRKKIAENHDVVWQTVIHPSAVIGTETTIGEGTVIMANAVVNPCTVIGKHCIINTGAVIEHDNILHDYVHISPCAALCGTITVGELTHIGAGAVVRNNMTICDRAVVGAGSAVVKNITESGIYVGVPAVRIK